MEVGRARLAGYRAAVRGPELVAYGDFSEAGGANAMRTLLEREPELDAVFAASDLMASGALRALRDAGLRVPQDVAVVGFEDAPVARQTEPPLTTVHQPVEEMGRRMAELLVGRIRRRAGREFPRPAGHPPGPSRLRLTAVASASSLLTTGTWRRNGCETPVGRLWHGTAPPCRPGREELHVAAGTGHSAGPPRCLGQVARTLGVAGADIVQVVVLERLGGRAVDDFTVVWPGASRVERLLAGLAAIPGVQVDGVWKAIGAPVSGGHDAELLAQVAANPADGLATLVDAVPGLLAADWAAAAVVPADWAARTAAPRGVRRASRWPPSRPWRTRAGAPRPRSTCPR